MRRSDPRAVADQDFVDGADVLYRFHDHLDLVRIVASQLNREFGPILEYEEMISFGQEGLLIASRRFDPERGVSFRHYAFYRVRGAILDGIRTHGPASRRMHEKVRALRAANLVAAGFFEDQDNESCASLSPSQADQGLSENLSVLATAMALGFSGEAVLQGKGKGGGKEIVVHEMADEAVEHEQLTEILYAELDRLPDREATLIRRHFFNEEDIDDISESIGISKSWGSRLLHRGLSRLTKRLKAQV